MRNAGSNKSSYSEKVRAGERPFVYSQEYQDWFRAVRGTADAQTKADAHSRWERRQHRISVPSE